MYRYEITQKGLQVTYICYIWNNWHQPSNKEQYTHFWHISHNKYGCHIPNIAHIDNMLKGHVDPTYLYIYAKTTNCNCYITPYCQYIFQMQIYPPNYAYMPTMWHAPMWDVCVYMCHIWRMCIKSLFCQSGIYTHTYTQQMVITIGWIWLHQINQN